MGSNQLMADMIVNLSVDNQSSLPLATGLRDFQTLSSLSGITQDSNSASFIHRMAFRNWHQATGGFAQSNKRNVVYQLDFTVNDPLNRGYIIDLQNTIRGIATIHIDPADAPGLSTATGLRLVSSILSSASQPLFGISGGTTGVGNQSVGQFAVYEEWTGNESMGQFFGTTDFSLFLSSVTSPSTNVVFANNVTGVGELVYGLGSIPSGFEHLQLSDMGHFLTVNVAFSAVPEPGSGCLVGLTGLVIATTRWRRNVRFN